MSSKYVSILILGLYKCKTKKILTQVQNQRPQIKDKITMTRKNIITQRFSIIKFVTYFVILDLKAVLVLPF